jgi:predicted carbohydrate-binding protein with CBM5 and CBM33 domain
VLILILKTFKTIQETKFKMQLTLSVLTAAAMATVANAHGYFTSPGARQPGPAYQKSCGMQAYYNMVGSINGNIQGLYQVVSSQPDYNPATCKLWKCKGRHSKTFENISY